MIEPGALVGRERFTPLVNIVAPFEAPEQVSLGGLIEGCRPWAGAHPLLERALVVRALDVVGSCLALRPAASDAQAFGDAYIQSSQCCPASDADIRFRRSPFFALVAGLGAVEGGADRRFGRSWLDFS